MKYKKLKYRFYNAYLPMPGCTVQRLFWGNSKQWPIENWFSELPKDMKRQIRRCGTSIKKLKEIVDYAGVLGIFIFEEVTTKDRLVLIKWNYKDKLELITEGELILKWL